MPTHQQPEPSSNVPGRILPPNPDGISGRVDGWFKPRGPAHIELHLPATGQIRVAIEGEQFTLELPEAVAWDVAEALIAVAGQLSAARAAHLQKEANTPQPPSAGKEP